MTSAEAVTAFVALFVMIDPIGLAPLFIALTQGMTPQQRHRVGLRALLIAFVLLVVFGLAGEALLEAIGTSMSAFRIAGGILMFIMAVDMLFEKRSERRGKQAEEHRPDPTVFPLATPLIAGPGAFATMVLLAGRQSGDVGGLIFVHAILFSVLFLTYLLFLSGGLIERVLGHTGVTVITRLLGILLAALAVQFVLDGLAEYGFRAS